MISKDDFFKLWVDGDIDKLYNILGTYGEIAYDCKTYNSNGEFTFEGVWRTGLPVNSRTTTIILYDTAFRITQCNGRIVSLEKDVLL